MFSAQERFICLRGTEGRYKGQRQEAKVEGEGKTNKGEGGKGVCPLGNKGVPLEREETDIE